MDEKRNLREQGKLLLPKLDVVFHALFREENKDILGVLVSDIIKEEVKIKSIDKNRYVNIIEADDKLGVMDIRADLENDTNCIIEIQLKPCKNEPERILYYWADAYARQAKRGEKYKILKKTISIAILDHELEALKGIDELGVKWQIREELTGKRVLTDRLELIIIEIPKAIKLYAKMPQNPICQWMMFLDNPNQKEVASIMEENKAIKKAIGELEQVSGDEKIRRIAELKEKYIRDEQASLEYAKDEGYKTGKEEGMKAGIEEGMKAGIEEGMKAGRNEGKNEIAKNMLKENLSIELISRLTSLSQEEIEKLKE